MARYGTRLLQVSVLTLQNFTQLTSEGHPLLSSPIWLHFWNQSSCQTNDTLKS